MPLADTILAEMKDAIVRRLKASLLTQPERPALDERHRLAGGSYGQFDDQPEVLRPGTGRRRHTPGRGI